MTEYLIHVGPQKTGTKYLQSHFFNLRHELLNDGIYYPSEWWTSTNQIFHTRFLLELSDTDGSELRKTLQKINAHGYRRVLLSTEGLSELPLEKIALMKEAIGVPDIKIIYYLRQWSDRIPSDWQQDVSSGHYYDFPAYYLNLIQDPLHSLRINYCIALDKLAKVFGRENLVLISYSNLKRQNIDLFSHFAKSALGWEKPYSVEGKIYTNVSTTPEVSEITRCLNFLEFNRVGRITGNMRVRLFVLRAELKAEMDELLELMQKDILSINISDSAPQFDCAYDLLMSYSDRIINLDPEFGAFERRSKAQRAVASNFLMREGVMPLLTKLHKHLVSREVEHPDLERSQAS